MRSLMTILLVILAVSAQAKSEPGTIQYSVEVEEFACFMTTLDALASATDQVKELGLAKCDEANGLLASSSSDELKVEVFNRPSCGAVVVTADFTCALLPSEE